MKITNPLPFVVTIGFIDSKGGQDSVQLQPRATWETPLGAHVDASIFQVYPALRIATMVPSFSPPVTEVPMGVVGTVTGGKVVLPSDIAHKPVTEKAEIDTDTDTDTELSTPSKLQKRKNRKSR